MTSENIVDTACNALSDKKGKDILAINVKERASICDYFIICSGSSVSHVRSLCDNMEKELKEKHEIVAKSKEGYGEGRWVALDYGDVIVHIFNDETRLFYHLERLWSYGDNVKRIN
jgi:ribosome-associated protein